MSTSEQIRVEGEAGSVAGARWAAMKKLEEQHPEIDTDEVRFETVSEGDRVVVAALVGGLESAATEDEQPAAEQATEIVETETARPAFVIEHAHQAGGERADDDAEDEDEGDADDVPEPAKVADRARDDEAEEESDDWRLELPDLPDGPAERVKTIVEVVLDGFDLDAEVDITESKDEIVATVSGEDVGLLIGKHGQTIDAVQLVCLQAAFRSSEDRKRVVVDAEGYRDRRNEALQRQADRAVGEALQDERAVEMESMTAQERRVVHNYLKENPDVETHSEGDDPYRFIVVTPVGGSIHD